MWPSSRPPRCGPDVMQMPWWGLCPRGRPQQREKQANFSRLSGNSLWLQRSRLEWSQKGKRSEHLYIVITLTSRDGNAFCERSPLRRKQLLYKFSSAATSLLSTTLFQRRTNLCKYLTANTNYTRISEQIKTQGGYPPYVSARLPFKIGNWVLFQQTYEL